MSTQNVINWFEIPAVDFGRAVKFYNDIFDVELSVTRMDDIQMGLFPTSDNSVSGAVTAHAEMKPSVDGTLIYLNGGNDLNTVLGKIESAGGKVIVPKTSITPEIGFFAIFLDSEGNRVGLHSMN